MALFKILRGSRDNLDGKELHDGYAYFTPDTGEFFIDYLDNKDGQLYRKKISDTTKTSVQIKDWTIEEEIEYVSFTLTTSNYADAGLPSKDEFDIGSIETIIIPETFTKDGVTYQVTAIDDYFGYVAVAPTYVSIPASVTSLSIEDASSLNAVPATINYGGTKEAWIAMIEATGIIGNQNYWVNDPVNDFWVTFETYPG